MDPGLFVGGYGDKHINVLWACFGVCMCACICMTVINQEISRPVK